jgi:hypothetical protein
MIQIAEDLGTLLDDAMALLALDVSNEPHAAGVMFVRRIIESHALG